MHQVIWKEAVVTEHSPDLFKTKTFFVPYGLLTNATSAINYIDLFLL